MKYYLIVGEASGDLHASHLMMALKEQDKEAQFRFIGGDCMTAVGGTRVRHFKEMAYMGFIPVLMHLPTIMRNMSFCKKDIMEWQPDVVIPVDYAGFNLKICKFLREQREKANQTTITQHPTPITCYYISPKIWAWKEYRIKNFKRDVEEMLCILPFEVDFFEKKHNYPVHYVGNPTADEVREFKSKYQHSLEQFCKEGNLDSSKPIIALLPGSRMQEIKDNLPAMISVAHEVKGYQYVIAKAPAIAPEVYDRYLSASDGIDVKLYQLPASDSKRPGGSSFTLLSHATAALVTSGTATLETALFDVPQVVCYKTPLPWLFRWGFNHVIKCKFISLVNLIGDKEIVRELFADLFRIDLIVRELKAVLPGGEKRAQMMSDYAEVHRRLGDTSAPFNAAKVIIEGMRK